METPEVKKETEKTKVEYTLDHLFRVCGTATITVRGASRKFYLRTVGQSAEDYRRRYAVSKSREILAKLRDESSPEYAQFLSEFAGLPREQLQETLLPSKLTSLRQAAEKEINRANYPEPDPDGGLVEILDTEALNEKLEKELETERAAYVDRKLEELKVEMADWPLERLQQECREGRTDLIASNEYLSALYNATLYFATFSDPKHRTLFFASPEEVGEADPGLRTELINQYFLTDAFSQKPDELKN